MHILVLPYFQAVWMEPLRCPQATFLLASAMRINPLKRREKRGKRSPWPYLCAHTWSRDVHSTLLNLHGVGARLVEVSTNIHTIRYEVMSHKKFGLKKT